ncbi:hypothetical protein BKA70DRAFT_1578670 [Coprinopsis sp. MPI-PUGE-AT-0042]|nr:hypothetical protein BKA70DRAFT_1578670 [Coprinopsis sp. MPI-PUGE-AT-0042]
MPPDAQDLESLSHDDFEKQASDSLIAVRGAALMVPTLQYIQPLRSGDLTKFAVLRSILQTSNGLHHLPAITEACLVHLNTSLLPLPLKNGKPTPSTVNRVRLAQSAMSAFEDIWDRIHNGKNPSAHSWVTPFEEKLKPHLRSLGLWLQYCIQNDTNAMNAIWLLVKLVGLRKPPTVSSDIQHGLSRNSALFNALISAWLLKQGDVTSTSNRESGFDGGEYFVLPTLATTENEQSHCPLLDPMLDFFDSPVMRRRFLLRWRGHCALDAIDPSALLVHTLASRIKQIRLAYSQGLCSTWFALRTHQAIGHMANGLLQEGNEGTIPGVRRQLYRSRFISEYSLATLVISKRAEKERNPTFSFFCLEFFGNMLLQDILVTESHYAAVEAFKSLLRFGLLTMFSNAIAGIERLEGNELPGVQGDGAEDKVHKLATRLVVYAVSLGVSYPSIGLLTANALSNLSRDIRKYLRIAMERHHGDVKLKTLGRFSDWMTCANNNLVRWDQRYRRIRDDGNLLRCDGVNISIPIAIYHFRGLRPRRALVAPRLFIVVLHVREMTGYCDNRHECKGLNRLRIALLQEDFIYHNRVRHWHIHIVETAYINQSGPNTLQPLHAAGSMAIYNALQLPPLMRLQNIHDRPFTDGKEAQIPELEERMAQDFLKWGREQGPHDTPGCFCRLVEGHFRISQLTLVVTLKVRNDRVLHGNSRVGFNVTVLDAIARVCKPRPVEVRSEDRA